MIELFNAQDKVDLPQGTLQKMRSFLNEVLKIEGASRRKITLVFVDNEYIWDLNKKFLKQDAPTDVLAFPIEGAEEIYVSVEMALKRGKENYLLEILRYAVHGILHLLGYTHENRTTERVLREKEDFYLRLWEEKFKDV